MKCVNCKKDYDSFTLANYNLDLCETCIEQFEKEEGIEDDYSCDKVTHQITCPKCGKVYEHFIVDKKCETTECNVYFFWDSLDCKVFARWLKEKK